MNHSFRFLKHLHYLYTHLKAWQNLFLRKKISKGILVCAYSDRLGAYRTDLGAHRLSVGYTHTLLIANTYAPMHSLGAYRSTLGAHRLTVGAYAFVRCL